MNEISKLTLRFQVDFKLTFKLKCIGWPVGRTSAKIRDLWARQDLGTFQNNFVSDELAAHASIMLKVTPQ